MKNGLWNLFLVWDPNENNDNLILYKWFSAHLIAITDGKGLSTSLLTPYLKRNNNDFCFNFFDTVENDLHLALAYW
jgi:hypothetical protein